MIPDFETLEDLARRARVERSLYIAELIATAVMAIDERISTAWARSASFLRSLSATPRQAAPSRR
ncbi:MAG: hypothetical protein NDI88_08835 [Lysobacter sp.]|nr:hypothetical protein [Lysobacter sp.]